MGSPDTNVAGKDKGLPVQRYDSEGLVQGKRINETNILRMGEALLAKSMQ